MGESHVVTHTLMYLTCKIKRLIHFNLHMIQIIIKICKMHWHNIKTQICHLNNGKADIS